MATKHIIRFVSVWKQAEHKLEVATHPHVLDFEGGNVGILAQTYL